MTETFEQRQTRLDQFQTRLIAAADALAAVLKDPEVGSHEPELTAYRDALFWLESGSTCGDCIEGRCHWGGELSRKSIAEAAAGREYHHPGVGTCGCGRHEASVRARKRRARIEATAADR